MSGAARTLLSYCFASCGLLLIDVGLRAGCQDDVKRPLKDADHRLTTASNSSLSEDTANHTTSSYADLFCRFIAIGVGIGVLLWPELRRSYNSFDDVRQAFTSLCNRLTPAWLVLVAVYVHEQGAAVLYAELNPEIGSFVYYDRETRQYREIRYKDFVCNRPLPVSVLIGLSAVVVWLVTAVEVISHLSVYRTLRGVDWSTVHDVSAPAAVHVLIAMLVCGTCYPTLIVTAMYIWRCHSAGFLLSAGLQKLKLLGGPPSLHRQLAVILFAVCVVPEMASTRWFRRTKASTFIIWIVCLNARTFIQAVEALLVYLFSCSNTSKKIGVIDMHCTNKKMVFHLICKTFATAVAMLLASSSLVSTREETDDHLLSAVVVIMFIIVDALNVLIVWDNRTAPAAYVAGVTYDLGIGHPQLADDHVCPICRQAMTKTTARVTRSCEHLFHDACLVAKATEIYSSSSSSEWSKSCNSMKCPTCDQQLLVEC